MHSKYENCKREVGAVRKHHMIPRQKGGFYLDNNTINLCRPCEQFLHYMFVNAELRKHFDTKEKILNNSLMIKFGKWINITQFVRPKFKTILKGFIKYLDKK